MVKLTPKQEAFAKAYVEEGNASEAYRQAYSTANMKPETVHNKGYCLLQKDEVRARVEELQAVHQANHEVTVESLLRELGTVQKEALERGQMSAAARAIELKAKIVGLLVNQNKTRLAFEASSLSLDDAVVVLERMGITPEVQREQ